MTSNKQDLIITYQCWSNSTQGREISYTSCSISILIKLVHDMGSEHAAMLVLETDEKILSINVGQGLYSVNYFMKDGSKSINLISEAEDKATFDYVLGGQLVDTYPKRCIVPVADVITHTKYFYIHQTINTKDGKWAAY